MAKNSSRGRRMRRAPINDEVRRDMALRIIGRLDLAKKDQTPIDKVDQLHVIVLLRSDLDKLKVGAADIECVARIIGQINVSIMLCQANVASSREYLDVAIMARDAIQRMLERQNTTGKFILDGPGGSALTDWMELREELIETDHNNVGTESRARAAVEQEIRNGNTIWCEVAHG